MLASGSADKTIRIWNPSTGEIVAVLNGHTGGVRSVHFNPDGGRLVSGSTDKTVRVWSVAPPEAPCIIATLRGHEAVVQSVTFNRDGNRIASASGDRRIIIWDAVDYTDLLTLQGHSAKVNCVCFNGTGSWLASGSDDGTVRIWNCEDGALVKLFTRFACVTSLCCHGSLLVAGSSDGFILLGNLDSGASRLVLATGAHRGVLCACFNQKGDTLATGSASMLKVWDVDTCGRPVECALSPSFKDVSVADTPLLSYGHSSTVLSTSFNEADREIATGSLSGTISIIDATTGTPIRLLVGHESTVWSVCYALPTMILL
jgi:WD40 repeat protein